MFSLVMCIYALHLHSMGRRYNGMNRNLSRLVELYSRREIQKLQREKGCKEK